MRLRPVWSLAPVGPAISVTRRSTAVWMSSSVGANANEPDASSSSTRPSAASMTLPLPLVEQSDPLEHVHVRARSREIVGREPAVVRKADREGQQLVGRTLAEAAVPQTVGR